MLIESEEKLPKMTCGSKISTAAHSRKFGDFPHSLIFLCNNFFMKRPSLSEIFSIFCIIGVQLLGGGYVIVPLLKKYIVDERKWMCEEELVDFYAMSQCIPGIIAGNIAICAGYRARKTLGAAAALIGIIAPSFFAIILLANVLKGIVDIPLVQNAFWGIRISVIVLVIVTIKDLWKKSVNSLFSYILFFVILAALIIIPVSPAIIIIFSAFIALIVERFKRKKNA